MPATFHNLLNLLICKNFHQQIGFLFNFPKRIGFQNYSIMLCHRCSHIYVGEIWRSLRRRFGEHLRSLRNNTPAFPVAQHFNSAGHSITDSQVRDMRLCRGTTIARKQLDLKWLQIHLNCVRATLHALPLNVLFNGCFLHWNICGIRQFWHFSIVTTWNIKLSLNAS